MLLEEPKTATLQCSCLEFDTFQTLAEVRVHKTDLFRVFVQRPLLIIELPPSTRNDSNTLTQYLYISTTGFFFLWVYRY